MADQPLKIIIPIWSFTKSGGSRVLSKFANSWNELGIEVLFVAFYQSDEPYFPINCKIVFVDDNGDQTERKANYAKKKKKIELASVLYRKYKGLKNAINRYSGDYNVAIANYSLTAYSVAHSSIKRKFYYIQAYETHDKVSARSVFRRMLNALVIRSYKLDLIRIVNSDVYRNYRNLKSERVVYPGLDLSLYKPKDITYFNPVVHIGTIGRTEEWKGTADVCRAMEILHSQGVQFEFYIAFNDYETIPHHFVKPDGDENLSTFYRDMDIVVAACKGQHGAIHYPVIETMAVGSSIVCTDYYPSNDSNAYKVDESFPEQIAEAIKQILNNKEEAIRKRGQALKDVQQFDWPIVAQKFLDYLQEGNEDK